MNIPKLLHITHSSFKDVHPLFKKNIEIIKKNHSDWKVHFYSDNDILDVWGDGSPVRDFIHAKDVARGMIFAVENKITKPINLGSGTGFTIKELAEIVADYFGNEIKWSPEKPSGDAKRIFSMERANSYGFYPEIGIKEGILDTIEWFLNNPDKIDKKFNPLNK